MKKIRIPLSDLDRQAKKRARHGHANYREEVLGKAVALTDAYYELLIEDYDALCVKYRGHVPDRPGWGDRLSAFLKKRGIKECHSCSKRKKKLNRFGVWVHKKLRGK